MKIYQLKPNKKETLLAWGRELMTTHRAEALATLAEEHCTHEFGYIFSIGDVDYAALHMEGISILPPRESDLNKKHKELLRDCIEHSLDLKEIYDLIAE